MAEFTVNTHRFDPYKNFKFRVKWDGRYVPGVQRVSELRRTAEAIFRRDGNEPNTSRVSPGTWVFAPITLERGVTHDASFEDWANKALQYGAGHGGEMSLKSFRKDVLIELLNEQGQLVKAWKVYRCWVSEYVALSELDANNEAFALERIVLQNEGWERDLSVVEPAET